jgi:hypothetical protein
MNFILTGPVKEPWGVIFIQVYATDGFDIHISLVESTAIVEEEREWHCSVVVMTPVMDESLVRQYGPIMIEWRLVMPSTYGKMCDSSYFAAVFVNVNQMRPKVDDNPTSSSSIDALINIG